MFVVVTSVASVVGVCVSDVNDFACMCAVNEHVVVVIIIVLNIGGVGVVAVAGVYADVVVVDGVADI